MVESTVPGVGLKGVVGEIGVEVVIVDVPAERGVVGVDEAVDVFA